MNQSFKQFHLADFLIEGLEKMGITIPTPVQTQAIPAILQGKDVIGHSQTGTGKTLAYLLPVIQQVDIARPELQVLILAPTRELTRQIADTVGQLTGETGLTLLLIQGGEDINRQIQRLKRNPQIVVGTPGRVRDLIDQEKLPAHTARFLVLDEADTMLELGFRDDIEKIMRKMKRQLQVMFFSATLPPKVAAMAKTILKQPKHIAINPDRAIPAIENVFFKARTGGKEEALVNLVKLYNPYLAIVFAMRKEQVNDLVAQLHQAGIKAEGLHGDMQRGQRQQVMRRFREAKSQVLVATDIASRGLDIEGITHIFNYDLPISVDQYINRIGRTGRAGESGIAINLIEAGEREKLSYIENKLNLHFQEKTVTDGRIVDKTVRRRIGAANETGPARKLKAQTKKFTGPNAKKKAIKEAQQRKGRLKAEPATEKGKKKDTPIGAGKKESNIRSKDGERINRGRPVGRTGGTGSPIGKRSSTRPASR